MIDVVSSTRVSSEDFRQTPLGQSLLRLSDSRLTPKIRYENQERWGISEVYNDQIDTESDNDIILFVHDDVWLDDDLIVEKLVTALSVVQICGIAGIRILPPEHASWYFKNINGESNDPRDFSGRVTHFKSRGAGPDDFGPTPRQCWLMDGVFIAARRSVLRQNRVRFDVQFRKHCYDQDFCRTASSAGLVLSTWPIDITHDSAGNFGEEWKQTIPLYQAKWKIQDGNDGALPRWCPLRRYPDGIHSPGS